MEWLYRRKESGKVDLLKTLSTPLTILPVTSPFRIYLFSIQSPNYPSHAGNAFIFAFMIFVMLQEGKNVVKNSGFTGKGVFLGLLALI